MAFRWPWQRPRTGEPAAGAPEQAVAERGPRLPAGAPLPPTFALTGPVTMRSAAPTTLTDPRGGDQPLTVLRDPRVQTAQAVPIALATNGTELLWSEFAQPAPAPRPTVSPDAEEWNPWADEETEPEPQPERPHLPPVSARVVATELPDLRHPVRPPAAPQPMPAAGDLPEPPTPRTVVPVAGAGAPRPSLTEAGPAWVAEPTEPEKPWAPSEILHSVYREQDRTLANLYLELNGEAPEPPTVTPPVAPPPEPEPVVPEPIAAPEPVVALPVARPTARRATLAESRRRGLGRKQPELPQPASTDPRSTTTTPPEPAPEPPVLTDLAVAPPDPEPLTTRAATPQSDPATARTPVLADLTVPPRDDAPSREPAPREPSSPALTTAQHQAEPPALADLTIAPKGHHPAHPTPTDAATAAPNPPRETAPADLAPPPQESSSPDPTTPHGNTAAPHSTPQELTATHQTSLRETEPPILGDLTVAPLSNAAAHPNAPHELTDPTVAPQSNAAAPRNASQGSHLPAPTDPAIAAQSPRTAPHEFTDRTDTPHSATTADQTPLRQTEPPILGDLTVAPHDNAAAPRNASHELTDSTVAPQSDTTAPQEITDRTATPHSTTAHQTPLRQTEPPILGDLTVAPQSNAAAPHKTPHELTNPTVAPHSDLNAPQEITDRTATPHSDTTAHQTPPRQTEPPILGDLTVAPHGNAAPPRSQESHLPALTNPTVAAQSTDRTGTPHSDTTTDQTPLRQTEPPILGDLTVAPQSNAAAPHKTPHELTDPTVAPHAAPPHNAPQDTHLPAPTNPAGASHSDLTAPQEITDRTATPHSDTTAHQTPLRQTEPPILGDLTVAPHGNAAPPRSQESHLPALTNPTVAAQSTDRTATPHSDSTHQTPPRQAQPPTLTDLTVTPHGTTTAPQTPPRQTEPPALADLTVAPRRDPAPPREPGTNVPPHNDVTAPRAPEPLPQLPDRTVAPHPPEPTSRTIASRTPVWEPPSVVLADTWQAPVVAAPIAGQVLLAPVATAPAPAPARRLSTIATTAPASLVEPLRLALNADIGGVPVRRGPAVDATAAKLGARGYTAGGVVHIPDGAGPLDSTRATPLVAHELTHAVQQRRFGTTDLDQAEREAVAVEQWAANGFAGPPPVLRAPDPLDEWEAAMAADDESLDEASEAGEVGDEPGRLLDEWQSPMTAPTTEPDPLDEWEAATTATAVEFGPMPRPQAVGLRAAYEDMREFAQRPQPPNDRSGEDPPGGTGGGGGGNGDADDGPGEPPPLPPRPTRDEIVELIADDPPRRWLDLDDPEDFEEMANRLYNHLLGRLRFDVIVERERSGTLMDYR